jgi:hypothetical protein
MGSRESEPGGPLLVELVEALPLAAVLVSHEVDVESGLDAGSSGNHQVPVP